VPSDRFRADHVGSFLRPQELKDARVAHLEGKLPLDELRAIEDREILKVLELQREVGIDVYSDGEFRRGGWSGDFQEAVEGYVAGAPPVVMTWHGGAGGGAATAAPPSLAGIGIQSRVIGEKLRPVRRITAHETSFLKQHAPGPFKMTMPAATYVVTRGYKPTQAVELFVTGRGGRISYDGGQSIFRRLKKRSGVSIAHAHRFRHTWAQTALRKGAERALVQDALGHESDAMTVGTAAGCVRRPQRRRCPNSHPSSGVLLRVGDGGSFVFPSAFAGFDLDSVEAD